MLRMPAFQVHQPTSVSEAVALKSGLDGTTLYVAGGTDLLPNLKHGLHRPDHLVALGRLGLADIEERDGSLFIGAGVSLHTVATTLQGQLPGLAAAAGSVAGPQHRRMGTLGGNVMLDTRCLFYNQSEHWRKSLGYCLKAEGDYCHVIGSPKTCVAAHSADTVPVLIAMGARLHLEDADGPVQIELSDLFTQDGRYLNNRKVSEHALLHTIEVPLQAGQRSVYRKVRARGAVDFPQLGVALVGTFDGPTCTDLRGVVSALMPKPKPLRLDGAVGTQLDDTVIAELSERAYKQIRPQTQLHGDPTWRRHMVRVEVRRGLQALRSSGS